MKVPPIALTANANAANAAAFTSTAAAATTPTTGVRPLSHPDLGREAMVVVDNIGAFYFRDRVTESVVGNGTTLQLYALKVVLLKRKL